MTVGVDGNVDRQMIAAGNARGRMQQQRLADRVAFRVERLLHAQRTAMAIFAQHRAAGAGGEGQVQLGMPGGGIVGLENGRARSHGRIIREGPAAGNTQEYA